MNGWLYDGIGFGCWSGFYGIGFGFDGEMGGVGCCCLWSGIECWYLFLCSDGVCMGFGNIGLNGIVGGIFGGRVYIVGYCIWEVWWVLIGDRF